MRAFGARSTPPAVAASSPSAPGTSTDRPLAGLGVVDDLDAWWSTAIAGFGPFEAPWSRLGGGTASAATVLRRAADCWATSTAAIVPAASPAARGRCRGIGTRELGRASGCHEVLCLVHRDRRAPSGRRLDPDRLHRQVDVATESRCGCSCHARPSTVEATTLRHPPVVTLAKGQPPGFLNQGWSRTPAGYVGTPPS